MATILTVSNAAVSFGPDLVFEGVSFRVESGEKVALVGRNGEGKTTLLKAITKEVQLDDGSIHISKGVDVDYLSQVAGFAPEETVRSVAEKSRRHVLELRERLSLLERRMEAGVTDDEIEEYTVLHEHFLDNRGYAAETDIEIVLKRMGFTEQEFNKRAMELSGGEKTRLTLSRILLEEPDLLLLDEPTNHLDLEGAEWLEEWLQQYRGAVIAVSHDRRFLENFATRVIEMRGNAITDWRYPFTKYLRLREEDEQRRADIAAKQQRDIAALDEYVRRFMNSERVAQARGRLKHLGRLKQEQISAPTKSRVMSAPIKANKRSGDLVLETKSLTKSYDRTLFQDVDWTVRRGERWGVIGANGAGKSTLVKCALGLIAGDHGSARLGAAVDLGYFSQDATELDAHSTPLEILNRECGMDFPEARSLLGRFLLSGEQVFQPVATLSGGEKNKLALAVVTSRQPNTLVLDEPTNHLDMDSREALAQVLAEFDGTLILVSHDRYLLENVTNHTLDVREADVVQYPGSYAEYRLSRKPDKAVTAATKETPQSISQRDVSKRLAQLEKDIADLETAVEVAETALREHENRLSQLPPDADFHHETTEHERLKANLDTTVGRWEDASAEYERYRRMQG